MITKQRQYKRFQQHLKQALNNVQKYYSAISEMKKDSEAKTPLQKSKQIRRQKVQTFKTVEDEEGPKDKESLKYTTLTPKQKDFERVQMNVRKVNKRKQIKEFRMDESFSNKYNTVKKEYIDYSTLAGADIALSKEEISLKQTNKEKQCNKPKNKQESSHINNEQSIQETKNETSSGNGMLNLQNGWLYKGEYTNGLFHGFGQLFHNQSLVYSGNFQFGYFHGYGKLTNHKEFSYLISTNELVKVIKHRYNIQVEDADEWDTYCGEFSKGKVKGFGQLRLKTGEKIICKWSGGKIKGSHCTFLDSSSQV